MTVEPYIKNFIPHINPDYLRISVFVRRNGCHRTHGLISAYAYFQNCKKHTFNTQYALNNERQKLTTPQNLDASLVARDMTAYSTGRKNPKALHVDLMFTVESPKSEL